MSNEKEMSMDEKTKSGLSRRNFLKMGGGAFVGAAVGAACATAGVQVAQAHADEGAKPAMGHLVVNPDKCAGCRVCMAVCSLNHEGVSGPAYARIRVYQPSQNIFDTTIVTCKQCDSANCLAACPTGALYVDEKTGARVINKDKCTGCQTCVKACPQYPNAPIYYDTNTGTCFKCDLCGGDPQCVKNCTMSVSFSEHCLPVEDHVLKFSADENAKTTYELAHDPGREKLPSPEKPKE